jgi:transcriptional regulator with XRE-family HTH domain
MSDKDITFDGDLLRKQREIRGWTVNDIAARACLSVKQIRQLEEGGSESFYSSAVRLTAAKKVASLLGVSITPVQDQPQPTALVTDLHSGDAVDPKVASLAQAEFKIEAAPTETTQDTLAQAPKSTQVSVWVLAALFGSALLIAAWLNPSAEPLAPEAAPPLQILSSDVSETASAVAAVVSQAASSASAEPDLPVVVGDAPMASASASSSPSVRASNAAEAASK